MKNKPTVLIIEDDVALNEAYVTILKTAYENVFTAFNGEEALQVAEQHNPDVIFLDLRMPVMDGIGFLESYQPKEKHPDVHIVVFSNYDMQAEVDKAYDLGAERYVLKALATPSSLLKIVNDLS
ncbi:MAG: DNA-binding response regulator VicR [Candidatus Saccharibacteria bacterium]|nr:DNA-binding response regulator VicR [Candidatus Saccharibacteria bacterium]MDB5180466.1 DNA-binding response regulator VicR [Candidatus Saccharibacteria bacterium]